MIALILGACLLAVQFLITFILPSIQEAAASPAAGAFDQEFAAMNEGMERVVGQEVTAAQTAEAGVAPGPPVAGELAAAVTVEPAFAFAPGFALAPAFRSQYGWVGAFQLGGSLAGLILLGVGIYLLRTRKKAQLLDDPPAGRPEK